jgi:bifunctional DNA primase/polymerase-like protein
MTEQNNTDGTIARAQLLTHFYELLGKRAVLLPIPYGTKAPIFKGWQQTTFEQTQSVAYRQRLYKNIERGGNVGVLSGPVSGDLCMIDIDEDSWVEKFLESNPKLAGSLRTRGANGCQIWVRIVGEYPARRVNSGLKIPGKKPGSEKSVAEWRGGGGHQSVIWGHHPDGPDYQFLVEAPVVSIVIDEINWPAGWEMFFGDREPSDEGAGCVGIDSVNPELRDRIMRYIEQVEPAISGQGGSNPTYRLANLLVWGFALSRELAIAFMREYSKRCIPPWSQKEIEHKVDDALKTEHEKPRGYLLGGGDVEFVEFSAPKPSFPEEALYGLLGDITRFIAPQTESDPAAIYTQLLIAYGNNFGRKAYFQVERTKHYTNLFAVLVGRSSKGRKGTALDYIKTLYAQADPLYLPQFAEGLSSGEGLIWAVRDPIVKTQYNKKEHTTENVVIDSGVTDKRLLVIETEFARPLKVMARPTNILSTILRKIWDDGDLRTLTKNEPARATNVHGSVIAHITEEELEKELAECDLFNGFANRFLWVAVGRTQLLPEGGKVDQSTLDEFARRLKQHPFDSSNPSVYEMVRDEEAREHWCSIYADLSVERPGLLGAVTN